MFLLDTNVVSVLDPRREAGVAGLIAWIDRNGRILFLSVITIMEMQRGILKAERLGPSRRTHELRRLTEAILSSFGDRILSIDTGIAIGAAGLAERTRSIDIGTPDLLIAATAQVHGLTVLTRNLRHFRPTGVPAIDPFESLPPDA